MFPLAAVLLILAQAPEASSQPQPAQKPEASQPAAQKELEKGSLEGSVVNTVTGGPVRSATVTLQGVPQGVSRDQAQAPTTFTDVAGKFVFQAVAPGEYRINVTHDRFMPDPGGSGSAGAFDPSAPVKVEPGKPTTDVVVRMQPLAVITGRVTDEDGKPLLRAQVSVLRSADQNAGMQGMVFTDDLGEYRLFSVTPGKAMVRASYQPPQEPSGTTKSDRPSLAYAPVFYPNAEEASMASVLDIQPGSEVAGIDFRLRRVSATSISGRVKAPEGVKEWGASLDLWPEGQARRGMASANGWTSSSQPAFVMANIRPGAYTLEAHGFVDRQSYFASVLVTVGRDPVKNLEMALSPAIKLSGVVRIEGDDKTKPGGMFIGLSSISEQYFSGGGQVQADGSFTLENVQPGKWIVTLQGPANAFPKEIRLGRDTIRDQVIELAAGATGPMEIIASTRTAKLSGTVVDRDDKPGVGSMVVLIPQGDRSRNRQLWKMGPTGTGGTYQVQGIPPGEYYAIALDASSQRSLGTDPDGIIAAASANGESVRLDEGGEETRRLKVTALESAKP